MLLTVGPGCDTLPSLDHVVSGPGPALRHSQKWSDAAKRSQALPDVPRGRPDAPKTPPRPLGCLQDRSRTPEMTPKGPQHYPKSKLVTSKNNTKTTYNIINSLRLVFPITCLCLLNCRFLTSNSDSMQNNTPGTGFSGLESTIVNPVPTMVKYIFESVFLLIRSWG